MAKRAVVVEWLVHPIPGRYAGFYLCQVRVVDTASLLVETLSPARDADELLYIYFAEFEGSIPKALAKHKLTEAKAAADAYNAEVARLEKETRH